MARRRSTAGAKARGLRLTELPIDLQLLVAQHALDPRDCAVLCLAHPRLGLQAQRSFAHYGGPLFDVAMRLLSTPGFVIDEPLLRRYAADDAFTRDGCEWLRRAGSGLRLACHVLAGKEERRLYDGDTEGALAIVADSGLSAVTHYAGERGAERIVRMDRPDGVVMHHEGEPGQERMVRMEQLGAVALYEGERGEERTVQMERHDGVVMRYEGERGGERMVRVELPDGVIALYEGERGGERLLRVLEHLAGGVAMHYDGARGAERMVRVERPDGVVILFEGETGAERMVRLERPDGAVAVFEGVRGAERMVRVEGPVVVRRPVVLARRVEPVLARRVDGGLLHAQ